MTAMMLRFLLVVCGGSLCLRIDVYWRYLFRLENVPEGNGWDR